ncbi:CrcB protein [Tumebacillus sp. BK434]|uniref:fluoride efflux transporter CrcB n=1 Tax=Tumebacillus sp. BK434 TaxID=2512169 RepID=UPI00104FC5CF|nr:fluoride efflux transporter CrcB [Tumebacillus sp. BK434]TCP55966.1 CrcB protein [Tumebacillus sp. BK434]
MTMWLLTLLGGAIGAPLRYGLGRLILKMWRNAFPLPTFLINLLGSFCLGLLFAATEDGPWRWLLGTGLLGAFTTFSTFGVEAVTLLEQGRKGMALCYVLGSALAGMLAAGLGFAWYTGG